MSSSKLAEIIDGLQSGEVVPYLGPGVLADVKYTADGRTLLGEGESLILAMNGGRPMNARLMTEFPRAAMSLELSKGRKFLMNFLEKTYGTTYDGGAVHEWLASLPLPYIIDTNRDVRLQDLWVGRPHTLVVGIARLTASWNRFRIWESNGTSYRDVAPEAINRDLPVLFKPLGTPRPTPTFVASDADYVDYITELMGGFAIPGFLKEYRPGKRYLVIGLRLDARHAADDFDRHDRRRRFAGRVGADPGADGQGTALLCEAEPGDPRMRHSRTARGGRLCRCLGMQPTDLSFRASRNDKSCVGAEDDAGCLDDGVRRCAGFQAETCHRFLADDRHNLESVGKFQDHLAIDHARRDLEHGSLENIPGREFHAQPSKMQWENIGREVEMSSYRARISAATISTSSGGMPVSEPGGLSARP